MAGHSSTEGYGFTKKSYHRIVSQAVYLLIFLFSFYLKTNHKSGKTKKGEREKKGKGLTVQHQQYYIILKVICVLYLLIFLNNYTTYHKLYKPFNKKDRTYQNKLFYSKFLNRPSFQSRDLLEPFGDMNELPKCTYHLL